jgi:hypothetical protein
VPYREVSREDLWEEHIHRWGYSALFMVAVVRCSNCEQSFRAVSKPVIAAEQAATECLRLLAREGWLVREPQGAICTKCRGCAGPEQE